MFVRSELSNLPIGRELAQDIYADNGQLLIRKGVMLQESHLLRLRQRGYEYIYILEDGADIDKLSVINPDPKSSVEKRLSRVFEVAAQNMRKMMERVAAGHLIKPDEVEESIDIIHKDVISTHNIIKYLQNLGDRDEYTLHHSVSVGVLSIKIGQAMHLNDSTLRNLGIAGMLHDIGKCRIPLEIINKPGRLNEFECEKIKKHPSYGYQIVKDIRLEDQDIALAVLQHHECQDGKGYPLGIKGNRINLYARIIAVADVFDALTSDRAYRSRMPLLQAADIIKNSYGQLDPQIAGHLFHHIMDITAGEKVILSTGEEATIILQNEADPDRPLIKIGDIFLDLKKRHDIYIKDFAK